MRGALRFDEGRFVRAQFPGHYRPSQDEFQRMWRDALFVFDTNVMLHVYRYYFAQYRHDFLKVLHDIRDQLWLPHQVTRELEFPR